MGQSAECSQLLKYPRIAEKVCSALAEKFADNKPDVVIGPAIGGILVAYEVARALDVIGLEFKFNQGLEGYFQLYGIACGAVDNGAGSDDIAAHFYRKIFRYRKRNSL